MNLKVDGCQTQTSRPTTLYAKMRNFYFEVKDEKNGLYLIESNTLLPPLMFSFEQIGDVSCKWVCSEDIDLLIELNVERKTQRIEYAKEYELPVACLCETNFKVEQFNSGLQFENFKYFIDQMVEARALVPQGKSGNVEKYSCTICSRKWTLNKPAFPYIGCWE